MMTLSAVLGLLRGLPRPLVRGAGVVLALALLWHWHSAGVDRAFAAGGAAQAASDRNRVAAAAAAAAAAQQARIAGLARTQSRISKGSEDALVARNADLARRYDDLRLRWAAYRADRGRPGDSGAAAVPDAADGAAAIACAADGWVSFDTAAAAAHAADTAIAKDDAWIAWAAAQAAAWPKPTAVVTPTGIEPVLQP